MDATSHRLIDSYWHGRSFHDSYVNLRQKNFHYSFGLTSLAQRAVKQVIYDILIEYQQIIFNTQMLSIPCAFKER